MQAEIISIGDELTSGQRLDTNSQWLSQRLGDLGVQTMFHSTVGDDLNANINVFRTAAARVPLVVVTGGLGPTADDLTRDAMAAAFDLRLVENQDALVHIERLFSKRKRPMPERNRVQALFPMGARMIDNPHGTAPGIDLVVSGEKYPCRLFALPGVPAEMMQMWRESVQPRLISEMGVGEQRWFYRSIKVFGIGESDVEAKLPDLISRNRVPRVGITVSRATITLRIAMQAADDLQAEREMASTQQLIHECLGELVFGSESDELEHAVQRQLHILGQSLCIIEVGPDTRILPWMQRVDLANPSVLRGGLSFRSTDDLQRWAERFGYQAQGASQPIESLFRFVASIAGQHFQSDWSLILGPYPEHSQVESAKSIPTCSIHVVVQGPDRQSMGRTFELGGHPEVLYPRLAKTGLDQLRRAMLKSDRTSI